MAYIVVGILGSYRDAEEAVQDLENAGISGHEVEVISDIDEDARTANTPGEPSTKSGDPHHDWRARLFGPGGLLEKQQVRDQDGEQPNYIGEQEFYASHVKEGGAVVIVHTPAEPAANRAAAILHDHGARSPGRKDGPSVRQIG